MIRFALILNFAAAQLVGPGGMVPHGGGSGPPGRRGGGWGVVSKWPVGWYVDGSSIRDMNGFYVQQETMDHTLPTWCGVSWAHIDTGFKLGSCEVEGYEGVDGAAREWIFIDGEGRHVLAAKGGHYMPGGVRAWHVVRRAFRYPKVGDVTVMAKEEAGFWARGERGKVAAVDEPNAETPVLWRRLRDGKYYHVGAWRMRHEGGEENGLATGHEDEDDLLPWQVVGLMDRSRLDDYLRQKRAWDQEFDASFRRAPGERAVEGTTFGGREAQGLLAAGPASPEADSRVDEARRACHDGIDAPDPVALLKAVVEAAPRDEHQRLLNPKAEAEARAALSYCLRRAREPEAALAEADAGRRAYRKSKPALLERGLALLDSGRPCDAVKAFEDLYRADRAAPGLGDYLLVAHTRARVAACCAPASNFCVGDRVEALETLPAFWKAGDKATVIGVASAQAPVALRLDGQRGRLVDVQDFRIKLTNREATAPEDADDDPYARLGVPADFSADELRKAFRSASRECHPDKGGKQDDFTAVGKAHDVLADDAARAKWDAGEHLKRAQPFSLKDELMAAYWPELKPHRPFGDPHEYRNEERARKQKETLMEHADRLVREQYQESLKDKYNKFTRPFSNLFGGSK